MIPPLAPELVEVILAAVWDTVEWHERLRFMRSSLLVNHLWLATMVRIMYRDLHISSTVQMDAIYTVHRHGSAILRIAGVTEDVPTFLARTCRSITALALGFSYSWFETECVRIITAPDYVVEQLDVDNHMRGCKLQKFIAGFAPNVTRLHLHFVDIMPNNYRYWQMENFPGIQELWITFHYPSVPGNLAQRAGHDLLDAPRGRFPLIRPVLTRHLGAFPEVRTLVVRNANADFVHVIVSVCPQVEHIYTTTAQLEMPTDLNISLEYIPSHEPRVGSRANSQWVNKRRPPELLVQAARKR